MYSSQNISSIQIAILIIILFLTSRASTAVCQKNYDNWIFGDGAEVSFVHGTAEAMPPREKAYYFFAYSDDNGNLLCYGHSHNAITNDKGTFEISDRYGNVLTRCSAFLPQIYQYSKVCCISDCHDNSIYHVFFSYRERQYTNDHAVDKYKLHHIRLLIEGGNASLFSQEVYDDFVVDDFVALNVGNFPRLVVFDKGKSKIKVYDISAQMTLTSETDNPYQNSPTVRSEIRTSPDGANLIFECGTNYYKVEFDDYGNISPVIATNLKDVHCIEFSQSGDYIFAGKYGARKNEYLILRYKTSNLYKVSNIEADTIACLKKDFGEFTRRNDMLIGPDGNIYVGFYKDGYLSAIEKPESPLPECKFNYRSLYLNGALFANSFHHVPRYLPTFRCNDFCGTTSFNYCGTSAEIVLWDFGDGNSSAESNPVHSYKEPGTYEVTLHTIFPGKADRTVKRQVSINKSIAAPRIIPE